MITLCIVAFKDPGFINLKTWSSDKVEEYKHSELDVGKAELMKSA